MEFLTFVLIAVVLGFIFRHLRKEKETSWVITYYDKEGRPTGEEYVYGHITKGDVHEWVTTQTAQPFWNFTIEKL